MSVHHRPQSRGWGNMGILFKLHYFQPLNTRKQVYYSLAYPYLHYGILMSWGNTYPSWLTKVHSRESNAPYFRLLDILNIDIFKVLENFPSSPQKKFTKCSQYPWSVSRVPHKRVWYSLTRYQICFKSQFSCANYQNLGRHSYSTNTKTLSYCQFKKLYKRFLLHSKS